MSEIILNSDINFNKVVWVVQTNNNYEFHYKCSDFFWNTNIAYLFNNGKLSFNLNLLPGNFNEVRNMEFAFANCQNLFGSPLRAQNVINMSHSYEKCYNLSGVARSGPLVQDMSFAYSSCNNLLLSDSGPNVTNMHRAFSNCINLVGSPMCGRNVSDLSYAYINCYNLSGSPSVGNNVINMESAYSNCYSLTGTPKCGSSVTTMRYAYYNCYSLTGWPQCSNSVINMDYAYYNCTNLTGNPTASIRTKNLAYAYYNCSNLTGNPIASIQTKNLAYAYYNCSNLGTFFDLNLCSGTLIQDGSGIYSHEYNIYNCFGNWNNQKRLTIYTPLYNIRPYEVVAYNSATHLYEYIVIANQYTVTGIWDYIIRGIDLNPNDPYANLTIDGPVPADKSLVGQPITWTFKNTKYFNSQYNIIVRFAESEPVYLNAFSLSAICSDYATIEEIEYITI